MASLGSGRCVLCSLSQGSEQPIDNCFRGWPRFNGSQGSWSDTRDNYGVRHLGGHACDVPAGLQATQRSLHLWLRQCADHQRSVDTVSSLDLESSNQLNEHRQVVLRP